MEIKDQEIKEVLQDNFDSPSYGFSSKTMRLIERKKPVEEIYTPIKINRWILSVIFLSFGVCLLFAFSIDPIQWKVNLPLRMPRFSVFWVWGLSFLGMATGIWAWILLIKSGKFQGHRMG